MTRSFCRWGASYGLKVPLYSAPSANTASSRSSACGWIDAADALRPKAVTAMFIRHG
ncbi:hypothetical protein [Leisingera methylohalidivorans]|uniref:Uncharacterized protein n=1 Tax=Leisingera methylohalidivorans DSM 14336 TaxID=999552 RepID=V9W2S5_9RHOB|nr:hypothetical protein [Leisingera methylohalidivorans]AHD03482.1 hypothetical protein METH_21895 [Leisingera methylohalidivorans DSM 14336]